MGGGYDFIIVGSGTSGAVAAYHLQRAGARCLMLEAGRHYTAETFPRGEADYSAQLFWGGGVEFDVKASLAFLRGRCVGGGSIVNQCLLDRFDDVALDDWRADSGIPFFSPADMAPHYAEAESHLSLQDIPSRFHNRNAHLFRDGLEKLGLRWAPLRRGQRDCAHEQGNDCIGCLGGCHRDSKQSMLVTYLKEALELGLELWSETTVDRIEYGKDGVTFHLRRGSEAIALSAPQAILAAGAFGTTHLLLRSGFKERLPALGTRFAMHPQHMNFAFFDEPVDAHKGPFQALKSADPGLRKRGFKLENVFAQPISIAMLFDGFGVGLHEFMKKYRYMACMEIAVRDEATGEMRVNKKGRLEIVKRLTQQDRARAEDGLRTVNQIYSALGAKGIYQSQFRFGLHLMGGCAMGTEASRAVVNEGFEVYGHPRLHIADSSVFPNAPGINPALTIMALSTRMAKGLAN